MKRTLCKILLTQLCFVVFSIACSGGLPWDFSPEGTWVGKGKAKLCESDSDSVLDLSFDIAQKGNVLGRMTIANKDLGIHEENVAIGTVSSADGKTIELSGSLYDQDVFREYLKKERAGINFQPQSLLKDQPAIHEKMRLMLELPGYTPNFYFDLTTRGSWLKGYRLEGKVSGEVKGCKDQVISVQLAKQ